METSSTSISVAGEVDTTPTTTTDEATHWLTYRGDRRQSTFRNGRVGPTTTGEYLYPIDAAYDPDTDTTRIGFTVIRPVSGGAR